MAVDQETSIIMYNYCDCRENCKKLEEELPKLQEVNYVKRDPKESHRVIISITGDSFRVKKQLKKRHKLFTEHKQSPPKNNQEMAIVLAKLPPVQGINEQHTVASHSQQPVVDGTMAKKTLVVCCPICNHELELKKYNKQFRCDGCKEDGFGSRYRCNDCDYSLHKECLSPKPTISPEFLRGLKFQFCDQPCSTARPCYACGKAIHGYFYRCKSKQLNLHPYCSNLKCNLLGMDFVRRDKISSSLSKCICCKKTMKSGSCSYISACKRYHFHVYCITEMLHKAWKGDGINVSSSDKMSMPPKKSDSQPKKNRSGGGFAGILKTLSTVVGTIIGILLGDPTGALVPVFLDFVFNILAKKLPLALSARFGTGSYCLLGKSL